MPLPESGRNFHAAKASPLVGWDPSGNEAIGNLEEVTDGCPFRGDGRPTLALALCYQYPCQVSQDLVEINVLAPFIVKQEAFMRGVCCEK